MDKQNRKMATIFMACVTVVILSGLSCVWVWLLSDHTGATSPKTAIATEQRADTVREQRRAIAAKTAFRAMAKAMIEQRAVVSTGAKNWSQLFKKAEEDIQLEQVALSRLNQMANSENTPLSAWLEVAQSTRYKDSELGQTAYQIALDEITRVTAEDEKVFRAATYDDWRELYLVTPVHSELEQVAVVQMRETAETPDDLWLYSYSVL